MTETVFRNGASSCTDEVVRGDVVVRDGEIAAIDDPGHGQSGIDLEGDWLIPGLVELHTDHLEGHYAPRPRVRWNPVAAVQAHDAQIATSGITTVFDALRVGMDEDTKLEPADMRTLAGAIEEQPAPRPAAGRALHPPPLRGLGARRARELRRLRGRPARAHRLADGPHAGPAPVHLARRLPRLLPGQERHDRRRARGPDRPPAGAGRAVRPAPTGRRSPQMAQARGIVLASHDDATEDHVAEAVDPRRDAGRVPDHPRRPPRPRMPPASRC